ncbi:hypothetical protein N7533_008375 [Penicillium manginii]|uniref:uncharacterized protein n=1 Tax=Penicillium manginii TaxID=203109 RepID=UPI0025499C6C|nr:uncharacterized protein N7533_008375 [Penicillium manginii]KAJ5751347.1 hypothetical protein N7533_008375 [Penicillium manginii]
MSIRKGQDETSLARERNANYLGAAKVMLSDIQFDPPLPRNLSQKKLDRLKNIFYDKDCDRLNIHNRVPGVISSEEFRIATQSHGLTGDDLKHASSDNLPTLQFATEQLKALHGRHRIQVASEFLFPGDKWWVVDLYADEIGPRLRNALIDEYSYESAPTDGEIYRKIRQYETEGDAQFRQRWFSRLSRTNQTRLDQLDSRKNRCLRVAFDDLLPVTGLWRSGMRISLISRLVAAECREELTNYLHTIKMFWFGCISQDPLELEKVSSEDVEALQLKLPHLDSPESSNIRTMIIDGRIFSSFTECEREAIVERIINMDVFIPSLHSFFEDFKLLECWSNCIKRLCPPVQDSIQLTLRYMFNATDLQEQYSKNGRNPFPIELGHNDIAYANLKISDSFDIGYRQLWLYSVRNYHRMPPEPIKKSRLLATPNRGEADYHTVYNMAKLAERLGFQSKQIQDILNDPPDRKIAYNMLLKARDPSAFRYNSAKVEKFIDVIVKCFDSAKAIRPTSCATPIPGPVHRCGIQQTDAHIGSTNMLYVTKIFGPTGL